MTITPGRPIIAIPGPSPTPDQVLSAMHRPSPDIYTGDLGELNLAVMAGLKRVAGTTSNLAPYIGNGHAAWQAANSNLFGRGDKALMVASGHFGRSWAEFTRSQGVEVDVLDCAEAPPDPARLGEVLSRDHAQAIKAVMVCQTDTASSARADIPAIRAAMDGHPALLVVDAIASLGCSPMQMDAWGVDVLIAASQKGLMSVPGTCFVWFSDRAAMVGRTDLYAPYWDWQVRADATELWQFWGGTAPVQQVYGLAEAIAMLEAEGLDAVWARHEKLAAATWAAFDAWDDGASGIHMNIADPHGRAHSVTAARLPGADHLRAWLAEHAGVTLGIGLGAADPANALRVAHMGHVNVATQLGVLAAMESGMQALSIPHGSGAIDAAAQVLAQLECQN